MGRLFLLGECLRFVILFFTSLNPFLIFVLMSVLIRSFDIYGWEKSVRIRDGRMIPWRKYG